MVEFGQCSYEPHLSDKEFQFKFIHETECYLYYFTILSKLLSIKQTAS